MNVCARKVFPLVGLVAILAGCAAPKVECPNGFLVQGSDCVCPTGQHPELASTGAPVCQADNPGTGSPDVIVTPDSAGPETSGQDVKDSTGNDTTGSDVAIDGGPDAPDGSPAEVSKPDAGKDSGGGSNVVGSLCADDLDCLAGLSCFTWPKGYCTLTNCASPGQTCPGSAVCWSQDTSTSVCTQACDDNPDCRVGDGYACKRLSEDFGGVEARLCLPSGKTGAGLGCSKPLDCAGSATCLTDMPGGYCARVGCGIGDPCDPGTACVLRNGKPVCLKTCAGDTECQISTKQARKCVDKTDLGKKAVKVCLDSAKAGLVGAPCVADLDCDSKVCTLYAKGTCQGDASPCLADSQCGAAAPCVLDSSAEKGTCSAPCSGDQKCSTGLCVPGSDPTTGTCEPSCKGPGDDASCGGVPGLMCLFGTPLPPPFGTAVSAYACAARPKGGPGADCTVPSDCASKNCFLNPQGNAGFCTGSCANKKPCPFGTVCIDTGVSQCLRMCSGEYDCPSQMACKASAQSATKVCLPP